MRVLAKLAASRGAEGAAHPEVREEYPLITAAQIAPFRTAGVDYEQTQKLKAKLAQIRQARQPVYLTAVELEELLEWKLGQQLGRQRAIRAANTDEIVRAVTGLALTITHPDREYELELRVNVLCALRGVGVPVASAVLALVFPEEYAVIDFRGWRQVFDADQTTFFVSDYQKYMREIRRLAVELGWAAQEVDYAIWEYDRSNTNLRRARNRATESELSDLEPETRRRVPE